LRISKEYYETGVTVTVEWALAQQLHVSYSSTVVPFVPIIYIESTSFQLTISYNTVYNLSVVAAAPCRPNTTAVSILKYGEI
jgi:hypothetical protein